MQMHVADFPGGGDVLHDEGVDERDAAPTERERLRDGREFGIEQVLRFA